MRSPWTVRHCLRLISDVRIDLQLGGMLGWGSVTARVRLGWAGSRSGSRPPSSQARQAPIAISRLVSRH